MARNAAGKRELAKQLLKAIGIAADIGIDFAVSALKVGIRDHARPAVAGAAHIDDVEIACADGAIKMGIDEIESGRGTPMSEQPRLDVFRSQRLAQQGVVEQVDLPHRQIVGGTPVPVKQFQIAGLWVGIVCTVSSHADFSAIDMRQQSRA